MVCNVCIFWTNLLTEFMNMALISTHSVSWSPNLQGLSCLVGMQALVVRYV